MPLDVALLTLLHLLIFAYWLGGDLGVFYSSYLLTDPKRAPAGRLAAGKVVADVDLAPRIALLMTLPTGLALADAKGWIALPMPALLGAFGAAAAWIFVVLRLHAKHGPPQLRRVDLGLRLAFFLALVGCGSAGLLGALELPLFLSAKLLLLAFCVAMGLLVRASLAPFGPAYISLATNGPSPESDAAIRASLG
ncbi:MAG: hypothetical protein K2Q06_02900, partial [Parvularculaceae bacterium]|nr:hypothetical protein [Parvularculaceae bacterium]